MIPPCDPSILEHNPQFKRLYENLTTSFLNPDASTRAQATNLARTAVEDLKRCQTQNAKKRIKEQMLSQLAFAPDTNLPAEHHDNLAIISLYLSTPPGPLNADQEPNETLSLLGPDIQTFTANIPSLIQPLSTLLNKSIQDLRALSAKDTAAEPERPSHNARARARDRRVRTSMAPVPPLADELSARVRALRQIQLAELPAARRKLAATAAQVVALRAGVLERSVVILERAKYGALARATRAKAEHLAIVAQGVEGKLEVTKLEIAATLYSPETTAALTRYQVHLRKTRERLEEQRMRTVEELKALGDPEVSDAGMETNEEGFDDIKSRYGGLIKEVELLKVEIARLGA